MALLQVSNTGSFTSFVRFETSQIHSANQELYSFSIFYHHRQAAKSNAKLSLGKLLISSTACAKVSKFLPERSQIVEFASKSLFAKTHRPKCYERLILCNACTLNASADVADDKVDGKTLYDVLGVSKEAEAKDIKAAYRQQVRRLHPDVAPLEKQEEFTTAFLQVHAAYITLADPHSRAKYDFQLSLLNFQSSGRIDRRLFEVGSVGGFGISRSEDKATAAETAAAYPWARSFSSKWKGMNWETDQCW